MGRRGCDRRYYNGDRDVVATCMYYFHTERKRTCSRYTDSNSLKLICISVSLASMMSI